MTEFEMLISSYTYEEKLKLLELINLIKAGKVSLAVSPDSASASTISADLQPIIP